MELFIIFSSVSRIEGANMVSVSLHQSVKLTYERHCKSADSIPDCTFVFTLIDRSTTWCRSWTNVSPQSASLVRRVHNVQSSHCSVFAERVPLLTDFSRKYSVYQFHGNIQGKVRRSLGISQSQMTWRD